jgi:hypothetical protein
VIAHRHHENEGARPFGVENTDHLSCEIGIRPVRRPAPAPERLAAEKGIEAERRDS